MVPHCSPWPSVELNASFRDRLSQRGKNDDTGWRPTSQLAPPRRGSRNKQPHSLQTNTKVFPLRPGRCRSRRHDALFASVGSSLPLDRNPPATDQGRQFRRVGMALRPVRLGRAQPRPRYGAVERSNVVFPKPAILTISGCGICRLPSDLKSCRGRGRVHCMVRVTLPGVVKQHRVACSSTNRQRTRPLPKCRCWRT